jgi:thiol:disulfide interchange protein DsbD
MTGRSPESAPAQWVEHRGVAFLAATVAATMAFAASAATSPPAPLPVDEAFPVTASLAAGKITVNFDVLPGHYLYRDRFELQANGQPTAALVLPKGKIKNDPNFGRVEVYEQPLVLSAAARLPGAATVRVTFQGCSEVAGVCYPPTQRTFTLPVGAKGVRPNEARPVSLGNQFKKQVSQ